MIISRIQNIISLLSSKCNSSDFGGKILPCANLLHARNLVIVLFSVIMLASCERHSPTWKTGEEEDGVQIFLCDINGNTLDYSHCMNTVLDIPYNYSGIIILRIESEEWIAIGRIIL